MLQLIYSEHNKLKQSVFTYVTVKQIITNHSQQNDSAASSETTAGDGDFKM